MPSSANRKSVTFAQVSLPEEVGTVSLPDDFTLEMEDDSTLLAYPEGTECISLRFSCISFMPKDGSENGGIAYVRRIAEEETLPLQEYPDKAAVFYEEESKQGGRHLLFKYWKVGAKNTLAIVSATILSKRRDDWRVRRALGLMPEIVASITITKLHEVIRAEGCEVETTVETSAPTPEKIEAFSRADQKWRKNGLAAAARMSAKYGKGKALTPDVLDAIFSAWMHHPAPKESPSEVANALGAAFGELFVSEKGFEWVVVTDEYGTEYAVRHAVGSTMAFPRASIEKRIEDETENFFKGIYLVVCAQLERAGEASE